jgi:hypothetical protein
MKNVRRLMAGGTTTLLAMFATACCRGDEALTLVLAQDAGMTVTKSGKNYIVEILVTVALFGLALWVVCKSSRRV